MATETANKIGELLNSYHYRTLLAMAEAAGLETQRENGKDLRKADLLAKMKAEFFAKARIKNSWKGMDEREWAVMNRLLLHGGEIATKSFRRELMRADLVTEAPEPEKPKQPYYAYRAGVPYDRGNYAGEPTRSHSRVFEDVIARLTWRGLLFSKNVSLNSVHAPYKIQFHPAAVIYVPEFVRRHLPEPEAPPPKLADWQPDRIESGAPALLLRDLYLYWDFVRRNEVNLIQSGLVGKRPLKQINKVLLIPDPLLKNVRSEDETGRLYLLRQLLEKCELVHKDRGALRPVGEDPLCVLEFWSRDRTEQLKVCLKAWPQLKGGQELGPEADDYSPLYRYARQAVLDALKTHYQADNWVEISDLLEQLQAQNVNFLFSEHDDVENSRRRRYHSYHRGRYRDPKSLLKEFERLESEFVTGCLTGFLHQTDVVELGYRGDRLKAFRLTPRGRAMLGLKAEEQPDQPAAEESGKLIIQPNFHLMAIGPVSLALLAQLDLFAERRQADVGAFEYRLSRESVYQAQQMGMSVSEVLRFLEPHSDTDLPQNVRRSLDEWAAHHERVVFRSGVSLLQAADADLLAALMDRQDSGEHLARSVAPAVALLKKNRQESLVSALVEQGLLPAISDDKPESADEGVIVDENGSIHAIHAVPSLYLQNRVSRLAEDVGDGEWALTPASVQQAGGNKRKVLRMLEELKKLHRGSFPARLIEQIKAWGGYYGDAAIETLTLIEFRDQAALDELRGQANLQELLTPFPAKDRALAVVPTQALEEVKEILERFGVRVAGGLRKE